MDPVPPRDTGEDAGRRNNLRAPLGIPGRLILRDGKCNCVVEDISRQGACVVAEEELHVGDHGMLQRDGLDHFFTVHWVEEGRCGLSFDRAVPKDVILDLRYLAENYDRAMEDNLREFGREWVTGETWPSRNH
jgi:PilZ domain